MARNVTRTGFKSRAPRRRLLWQRIRIPGLLTLIIAGWFGVLCAGPERVARRARRQDPSFTLSKKRRLRPRSRVQTRWPVRSVRARLRLRYRGSLRRAALPEKRARRMPDTERLQGSREPLHPVCVYWKRAARQSRDAISLQWSGRGRPQAQAGRRSREEDPLPATSSACSRRKGNG